MRRIIALPLRALSKLPWDNRGAIAIISGLVLVPVLLFAALVVDVGRMYYVRRDLQNIADAACLACGYGLDESSTQALANAYKALDANGFGTWNGSTTNPTFVPNEGNSDPVVVAPLPGGGNPQVKVTLTQNTGLFFARIINHLSKDIGASATCELRSQKGAPVLPFGVVSRNPGDHCECDASGNCETVFDQNPIHPGDGLLFGYPLGEEVELKLKKPGEEGSPGNTNALAIGGTGVPDFKRNIVNGSPPVYLCSPTQKIETEPGTMAQAARDALNDRIGQGANADSCTLYNVVACYPADIDCDPADQVVLGDWISPSNGCTPEADPACPCPTGCGKGTWGDCLCSPWYYYDDFPLAVGFNELRDPDHGVGIYDCPRVGIIPFIKELGPGRSDQVEIMGFGFFFITDWGGSTSEAWVKGIFLRAPSNISEAKALGAYDPGWFTVVTLVK